MHVVILGVALVILLIAVIVKLVDLPPVLAGLYAQLPWLRGVRLVARVLNGDVLCLIDITWVDRRDSLAVPVGRLLVAGRVGGSACLLGVLGLRLDGLDQVVIVVSVLQADLPVALLVIVVWRGRIISRVGHGDTVVTHEIPLLLWIGTWSTRRTWSLGVLVLLGIAGSKYVFAFKVFEIDVIRALVYRRLAPLNTV